MSWDSGRLEKMEVNLNRPDYCHVRTAVKASMRSATYTVYLLLHTLLEAEYRWREHVSVSFKTEIIGMLTLGTVEGSSDSSSLQCWHLSSKIRDMHKSCPLTRSKNLGKREPAVPQYCRSKSSRVRLSS